MATIDVSAAFKTKNNLLRKLFHKGQPGEILTLRFFKPSGNAAGGRTVTASTTDGWNHKEHKDPQTGAVSEVVKISQSSTITATVIKEAAGLDIVYADSSFDRFTIPAKSPLNPISHEWILTVQPNKADKTVIT